MIYLNRQEVRDNYLGLNKSTKIYAGSNLVLGQDEPVPEPQTVIINAQEMATYFGWTQNTDLTDLTEQLNYNGVTLNFIKGDAARPAYNKASGELRLYGLRSGDITTSNQMTISIPGHVITKVSFRSSSGHEWVHEDCPEASGLVNVEYYDDYGYYIRGQEFSFSPGVSSPTFANSSGSGVNNQRRFPEIIIQYV